MTRPATPDEIIRELERHRDMYREHLAWLDKTILAAKGVEPWPIPITPPSEEKQ